MTVAWGPTACEKSIDVPAICAGPQNSWQINDVIMKDGKTCEYSMQMQPSFLRRREFTLRQEWRPD